MADDPHNGKRPETDRRDFLARCGRFAAATPPVVSLMLSVGDKARADDLATSGTTTRTRTRSTHKTTTYRTTSLTTTSYTKTTDKTTSITTYITILRREDGGSEPISKLASIIDSMGVMKNG
jgi:hypothetical protein